MTSYYFSKALNIPLDEAIDRVSAALEEHGKFSPAGDAHPVLRTYVGQGRIAP